MEQTQQTSSSAKATEDKATKQTNIMALISYIGPLCLIPLLMQEKDEFVRFHMRQGVVLFISEVAASIILGIIPILWAIGWMINIIWLVLSIVGIMNVLKNEKKQLPIIGKYADKFKI